MEAGGPGVCEHGVGDPDPLHDPPVQVHRADPQPRLQEPEPRVTPGLTEIDIEHKVIYIILRRGHGSLIHNSGLSTYLPMSPNGNGHLYQGQVVEVIGHAEFHLLFIE